MIKPIETLIKFAIPTLILTSIAYELMYFQALGISISDTPIGISDLFRSWMSWYATVIAVLFGFFIPESIFKRVENYKTEDQLINETSNPKQTRAIRANANKVLKWAWLSLSIIPILFGESFILFAYSGVFLFSVSFVRWLDVGKTKQDQLNTLIYTFIFLFLSFFAFRGFTDGAMIAKKKASVFVDYKGQNLNVVRVFDQWTLATCNNEDYVWIYHQSDRSLTTHAERKKFDGLIKMYFSHKT